MSFPRYPKYKDSGVEWLGEVPEHWEATRLDRISDFVNGKAHEPFVHDDGRFICVTSRFISTDGEATKLCSENLTPASRDDVLMVMSDLPNGRALARTFHVQDDREYAINQRVCAIRPAGASPRYLSFLLNRNPWFLQNDDGLNQTHLSVSDFRKMPLVLPPVDEQAAIATFLDRETAKIDDLIAEQQRLIELLQEKRQAVISHAVTKGLNPDAAMKDSGIEWLGKVPEHWRVVPLKYTCSLLKDGTHLPPARTAEGIPLLSVRNVIAGKFVLRDDDSMISPDSYAELSRSFVPQVDDVLLAIVGATLGKTAIVPAGLGKFHIQRSLGIFRVRDEVLLPKFLNAIFTSTPFQSKLWELVGYSAQPGIYLGTLQNLRMPVPPRHEQIVVVETLDKATETLTLLLAEAGQSIILLQERRSALISAAVTGQIDVRNYASEGAAA